MDKTLWKDGIEKYKNQSNRLAEVIHGDSFTEEEINKIRELLLKRSEQLNKFGKTNKLISVFLHDTQDLLRHNKPENFYQLYIDISQKIINSNKTNIKDFLTEKTKILGKDIADRIKKEKLDPTQINQAKEKAKVSFEKTSGSFLRRYTAEFESAIAEALGVYGPKER